MPLQTCYFVTLLPQSTTSDTQRQQTSRHVMSSWHKSLAATVTAPCSCNCNPQAAIVYSVAHHAQCVLCTKCSSKPTPAYPQPCSASDRPYSHQPYRTEDTRKAQKACRQHASELDMLHTPKPANPNPLDMLHTPKPANPNPQTPSAQKIELSLTRHWLITPGWVVVQEVYAWGNPQEAGPGPAQLPGMMS